MMPCVIKNKCKLPVKVHIDDLSDYVIYPGSRASVNDVAGSTLVFGTKVNVTTQRKEGSCFPRIVKKKVTGVESIDIVAYVSKITISD